MDKRITIICILLIFSACHKNNLAEVNESFQTAETSKLVAAESSSDKHKRGALKGISEAKPKSLLVQLKAPDPETRLAAKEALINSEESLELLINALGEIVENSKPPIETVITEAANGSEHIRTSAIQALMKRADEAMPLLISKWGECESRQTSRKSNAGKEKQAQVSKTKSFSTKRVKSSKRPEAFSSKASKSKKEVSAKRVKTISSSPVEEEVEQNILLFVSDSREDRVKATNRLVEIGKPSLPALRERMESLSERMRVWSITALGRLRDKDSLSKIEEISQTDPSYTVRRRAETAISRILGIEG